MPSRRAVPAALAVILLLAAGCSSSDNAAGTVAASPTTATTVPTTTTTTVPTTTVAPVTTPTPPAVPSEAARTSLGPDDLGASWHPGCPVGPDDLAMVSVSYWGFDDQAHTGSIVVNRSVVGAVEDIFRRLSDEHFPIRRVEPVSAFGGDDDSSMAADNTSGFNCRAAVADGPTHWSAHAYGQAIDVNPVENPYLKDGEILPPAGAHYADRADARPGMAVPGGLLVSAFADGGWSWGGRWASPDYQHFSATGG
jgi:hypothetical protein